jgi:metal transporter CNNM
MPRTDSSHDAIPKQSDDADLIDLTDGNGEGHRRVGSISAQSDVPIISSSPRATKATFMMRRSSAGLDGRVASAIPVKANLEEMRQQLKHLGPSNPATNPKNTKSTTVKIKGLGLPGLPSVIVAPPRPASVEGDVVVERAELDERDETTPLVRPKLSGKGGVQAVRKSYGGAGMSDVQCRLAGVDGLSDDELKKVGKDAATANLGAQTQIQPHRVELGALRGSPTGSHDSLSSLRSNGNGSGTPRRRPFVRSGSITENIIETGGVRKIVLQTGSSEEEDAERTTSRISRSKAMTAAESPESDGEVDGGDEPLSQDQVDGPSSASNIAGGTGSASGTNQQGNKNKNRRKKRKGNKH